MAGSRRRRAVLVALILVAGGVSPALGTAAAAGSPTPSGSAGLAHRVEVRPSARAATGVPRARGARAIPGRRAAGRTAGARAAGGRGSAPALLRNVNGISSRDSAVTNFNAEFEPPDQGLCVGNGFVLEPVNSAYIDLHDQLARVVRGPFNVNDLFNEGAAEFTSDPRCYFDPATHTWFATILFINSASTASRIDLAVNTSGDPTRLWTAVPDRHHRRRRGGRAESTRLPVPRRPAAARRRPDQRLHQHQRVLASSDRSSTVRRSTPSQGRPGHGQRGRHVRALRQPQHRRCGRRVRAAGDQHRQPGRPSTS